MKALKHFLNEEKQAKSASETLEDIGIDKEEQKQIEEDAAEKKRLEDEKKNQIVDED